MEIKMKELLSLTKMNQRTENLLMIDLGKMMMIIIILQRVYCIYLDREKQMNDDITFLKIKIMNFENQFNNIFFINDELKELKYKIKEYDQMNDSNKHYITELLNKSNEYQSKLSQIDKNIEDII